MCLTPLPLWWISRIAMRQGINRSSLTPWVCIVAYWVCDQMPAPVRYLCREQNYDCSSVKMESVQCALWETGCFSYWCSLVCCFLDSVKHTDISLLFLCSVVFQTAMQLWDNRIIDAAICLQVCLLLCLWSILWIALGWGIHRLCLVLHTRCLIICLPPSSLQCAEFWLQRTVDKWNQDIVPCG
jgi:hypothetical protein